MMPEKIFKYKVFRQELQHQKKEGEGLLMGTCNKNNFKKAMQYLFCVEGGYSCHKNDMGGATNFGITQVSYDTYLKGKGLASASVKNITKETAEQIYFENYWIPSGASVIDDFAIALILFDSCVNHGLSIGRSMYKKAGNNIDVFLNLRRDKYKAIVKKNPSQQVFYKGWMNRINRLENYIKNSK